MSKLVVFEDPGFRDLIPLVYWRAVFQLRCGRGSLLSKILSQCSDSDPILFLRPELAELVRQQVGFAVNPTLHDIDEDILLVNGRWLGNVPLPELPIDHYLLQGDTIVAARVSPEKGRELSANSLVRSDIRELTLKNCKPIAASDDIVIIKYPWDLVHQNTKEIIRECNDCSKQSDPYPGVHLLAEDNIHIGKNVSIKPGVVIDAEDGPIWIDDDVRILPSVVLQGPCYIGRKSLIQSSAHIREGSSIGPVSKIGGEVEESIIHGYSNKQHYGFLGHAYLGQWVNCGAGMTNSDLKNTYGSVRVTLDGKNEIDTGQMFVGVTIGDHTKIAIDVTFPTGSIVGTASMVALSQYAPKFVPSFRWITDNKQADYGIDQAITVAERVMSRRNLELTEAHRKLFLALPEITRKYENRQ